MTVDVVITDGTNAITLYVQRIVYDQEREPKTYPIKSIASVGAGPTIATDFGGYAERWYLQGYVKTRANAKNLINWSRSEWFTNQATFSITIPALNSDDDALSLGRTNTEPKILTLRCYSDVDLHGVTRFVAEVSFVMVKRL